MYTLLGAQKTNTTAYHPQTDGLVEQFNHTFTNILAKKVKRKNGRDWDVQLPYVLFAYRTSPQVKAPSFLCMAGTQYFLLLIIMLAHPDGRIRVNIDDYKEEMAAHMSSAWQASRDHIQIARSKQKPNYDKHKKATLHM